MNRTLIIPISFFCFLPLSGCGTTATGEMAYPQETPKVEIFTVQSTTVPLVRTLPGRTAAFNVAEVRPQVNGIIKARKFEEGALVTEGQELYEIDDAVYKAHHDKAIANLRHLERTLKRAKTLQIDNTVSEQEYEESLYAWESAKADAELARLDLEYCKVKAPLSGKIGRSTITVGALVTNGQPQEMAVIQQTDPIYVDLNPDIPQMLRTRNAMEGSDDRRPFWQGATVKLTLEDGTEYPHSGQIDFLDNRVQSDTGSVTLRAAIPNPDGHLLPGMFVRVSVEEGIRSDGKMIPQQAVLRDMKGNPYVWVVRQDDTVDKREIRTNRTIENTWLIDSGLEDGERIVVEGLQFVEQDGKVIPE